MIPHANYENKFSKVAQYKIQNKFSKVAQKSMAFLYTNDDQKLRQPRLQFHLVYFIPLS